MNERKSARFLLSLDRPHLKLLIDTQNRGIYGRIEIESNKIACLTSKLRIGTHAPRSLTR